MLLRYSRMQIIHLKDLELGMMDRKKSFGGILKELDKTIYCQTIVKLLEILRRNSEGSIYANSYLNLIKNLHI